MGGSRYQRHYYSSFVVAQLAPVAIFSTEGDPNAVIPQWQQGTSTPSSQKPKERTEKTVRALEGPICCRLRILA